MRLNDLMRVSMRQVIRHRRRYIGVVLAIALGVAGFLNIVTMSREVKKNFNENLDLIGGVTILRIYFDNERSYRPQWFREQTLAALKRLDGVKELSLTAARHGQTNFQGQHFDFPTMAVDEGFWQVRNFWPLTGKLFGLDAVTGHKREVVLGAELAKRIFGNTHVEAKTWRSTRRFIGCPGCWGELPIADWRTPCSCPSPPPRTVSRADCWPTVSICVAPPGMMSPPWRRQFPGSSNLANRPRNFTSKVSWEALKRVQLLAWWIEFLIYLATSATFLLGGVGIWNVMMAAVTSRTREIGLKKAMGAEDRDILAQFLSEALCLSVGAALLGAGLGRIMMELLSFIIDSRPPENLFFFGVTLAFLFAVVIGVGAGLYPSLRASRMEVVTAIRYE